MEKLTDFFRAAAKDPRITAMHILIYAALWECWHRDHFQSPVFISRKKIMGMTKISSIATYHKYMKELHRFGYIDYEPSYKPRMGTNVCFLPCT